MTPRSRRITARIMWLAYVGLCGVVLTLAGIYLYLDPQIPRAESYRHVKLETPLRVYTRDGALLAEFGERRLIPIAFDQVPPLFVSALLDTEDKRFYEHSGIDYISLTNDSLGLVKNLLFEESLGPGASTITMQLARNVSFGLERRFIRKFKEMLLALKIEQELTKDEILELYINVVPFGKRAYGAEAAARTYYGKSLNELTLPQLAMLAGVPQAPSAGNPINGPERALRRRNLVLYRMRDQDSITESQYRAALDAPITARVFGRDLDVAAPFPAEWVRQELIDQFPDLYTKGYEVFTTLEEPLQAAATRALRRGLINYDRLHGYRGVEDHLELPVTDRADDVSETEPVTPERVAEQLAEAEDPMLALAELEAEEAAREDWRAKLRERPIYADLMPAVVIAVEADHATAELGGGLQVELPLAVLRWARPYIDVDTRGPAPRSPDQVLTVGDVIRVQASEEGWRLAQLPDIQGALVSLDPTTGAVLALEGGFDFGLNQYNHALQAARQPGSGFKPFVYSAALHSGITPASIFMDMPLVFDDKNLESQYRPDNDNNRYNGPTRLREALYRSINLVSMRVLLKVGAGRALEYVSRFGFDTESFPRNTQLAIGGGTMAVTPLAMASAYAVFANGGYLVEPHIIDHVLDQDGEVVFDPRYPEVCKPCEEEEDTEEVVVEALLADEPANLEALFGLGPSAEDPVILATRVIDERNAFIMHDMLQDVIRKGTGRSARTNLQRGDLAGKTGTTNDAADTWFNGYTPDVVTTVWVGFPNHTPLGANAYGSNTPLPIWRDYMQVALDQRAESHPNQPPGIVTMKIDPATGALAAANQENALFELFLGEFAPKMTANKTFEVPKDPAQEEIDPEDLF